MCCWMKTLIRSRQASVLKDRKHRLKFKQDKHKGSHFFFFLSFFYFKENQSQKVEGEKKSDPTKYM